MCPRQSVALFAVEPIVVPLGPCIFARAFIPLYFLDLGRGLWSMRLFLSCRRVACALLFLLGSGGGHWQP